MRGFGAFHPCQTRSSFLTANEANRQQLITCVASSETRFGQLRFTTRHQAGLTQTRIRLSDSLLITSKFYALFLVATSRHSASCVLVVSPPIFFAALAT